MTKKVLLIFPGQPASQAQKSILLNLPLSILQLGGYLLEKGYQVVCFDSRIQDFSEVKSELKDCMAVGFSCMTGIQIKYALEFAGQIKQLYPKIPLIWGGIHATLFPEQTLENMFVDFIVKGEGEDSLFELLEHIASGNPKFGLIKGIGYKERDKTILNQDRIFLEMESLPLAAYHLVDVSRYPNILSAFDYQSSRGCPYKCTFCYNVAFNKLKYRAKSAEKVVSELEFLQKKYSVVKFSFNDDEFFIQASRVERFCDLIAEKKLKFEWNASCRLNIIRKFPDNFIKKIAGSGCRNINFGAESGSPLILKAILKAITTEDILFGAAKAVQNGITPYMSFMGGFPDETLEDTFLTKDIITKLWDLDKRIVVNGIFIFNPYPGTPLYGEAVKRGAELPGDLTGWGNFSFNYDADQPWVSENQRRILRVLFYIVRFKFYTHELSFRQNYGLPIKIIFFLFAWPWIISANLRWQYNFFKFPYEWYFFKIVMKKILGFI